MNLLVTGGAGFIGSHTVDTMLRRGHEVTILDDFNDFYSPGIKRENIAPVLDRVTLAEGDLRDRDFVTGLLNQNAFEAVIHLAARAGVRPSIADPGLYLSTNITGTFHLLEAARKSGVRRFLFASSSSVYGLNTKVPFSEDDPINQTISPYAATKLAGEQLCSNYAHLYGIEVVCLRFFTVYGPRQRPDLAISKFTRLIDEGRPIDRYGDGSTGRDYTYVDDIIQGIEGALAYEGPVFDIFNLGGGQVVSLQDLITSLENAIGKKAIIRELPEQPGDVPLTSAWVGKAKKLLGYAPRTPFETGIPRFVEWYFGNRAAREKSPAKA